MINVADNSDVPVAIIGMACRLPGADNLDQLWDIILSGRSVIGEFPPERFNRDLFYDAHVDTAGKTYSTLGGVLANRAFDRRNCPLATDLANQVDTSHLLMCDVAATACRHGGLDPFELPSRNVGVYIGHNSGSHLRGDAIYGRHIQEASAILNDAAAFRQLPPAIQESATQELAASAQRGIPTQTRLACSMIAGTISEAFGLTGPALALDSACASSLQALLVATRALQQSQVAMAIVGGSSDIKPDTLVEFAKAQAASATGSRPFDAAADGVICAEGYVALIVKTLPQAIADGDPIQAVVRGLGISSDGRGKGLWAPSPAGQVKAILRAYRGGVDLSQIQYIEALFATSDTAR